MNQKKLTLVILVIYSSNNMELLGICSKQFKKLYIQSCYVQFLLRYFFCSFNYWVVWSYFMNHFIADTVSQMLLNLQSTKIAIWFLLQIGKLKRAICCFCHLFVHIFISWINNFITLKISIRIVQSFALYILSSSYTLYILTLC